MNSSDDMGDERGGRIEYRHQLATADVAGYKAIDAAIRYLMPDATHSTAPALFDYRVSSHTVRAWRNGWRSVPQWAKDILDARIAARLAPGIRLQAAVRSAPVGGGHTWDPTGATLRAWRHARRQSSS